MSIEVMLETARSIYMIRLGVVLFSTWQENYKLFTTDLHGVTMIEKYL
jgi:hypothetical protein